jgi:hypothetical protein
MNKTKNVVYTLAIARDMIMARTAGCSVMVARVLWEDLVPVRVRAARKFV